MSDWENPVEKAIKDAIARGEFDDVPGEGKPLPRGENGPGWWARRYVERMRRDDRAVAATQEIESRMSEVWVLANETAVRQWVTSINEEFRAALGSESMDADEIVAVWKKMERARR